MGLIGRDDVVDRVARAVADGKAVAVVGAGGIGKTVVAEAAGTLQTRGFTRGGGVSLLATEPWFALDRAVGVLARSGGPQAVASRVVAALDGRALLVDDLQWVDAATQEVLGELVDKVAIVVTARPEAEAVAAGLGFGIEPLGRLDDSDADALARATVPGLSDAEVSAVVAFAQGVPLSIVTAARDGVDGLSDVVAARLARLSPAVRPAALRAAIATDELSATELGDAAEELDALGLLRPHAIIADAVIAGAGPEEVSAAHLWWADRSNTVSRRARHLLAAGDHATAREIAVAHAALADTDEEDAECLMVALAVTPDDHALQVRAVRSLIAARRFDDAATLGRRIEFVGDVTAQHADVAAVQLGLEVAADLVGIRDFVARLSPDEFLGSDIDDARRVGVSLLVTASNVAIHLETDRSVALAMAERAWHAARTTGHLVGEAARTLGLLRGEARLAGWREVIEEGLVVAEGEERLALINVLATVAPANGDYELAASAAARLDAEAGGSPWVTWTVVAAYHFALLAYRAGRFAESVAAVRAVDGVPAPALLRAELYGVAGVAAAMAGDDLRDEFERLVAGGPPDNPMASEFGTARAWMHAWLGDADAAAVASAVASASAASETQSEGAAEVAAWLAFERGGPVPPPPDDPYDRVAALRHAYAVAGDGHALRAVLADAETMGAVAIAQRCRAALRKRREPGFGGEDRARSEGLTEREREVLHLVRDGMTDAAIAAQLSLSRSTVSATVRRAAAKLGVTGRARAAAMLPL